MKEQGGFNERLKEELVKQRRLVEDGFYSRIIADEKLADAIRTLVLEEIIGEDDAQHTEEDFNGVKWCDNCDQILNGAHEELKCDCMMRNDLRSEQRKKLGEQE